VDIERPPLGVFGVGHPDCTPEEPLPDVGCARARSAQIGGPDNISQCFQVSAYSGEPFPSSLARNLLAKQRDRSALFDKLVENGPQVSFIFMSSLFTGYRERLAVVDDNPVCGVAFIVLNRQIVYSGVSGFLDGFDKPPSQVVGELKGSRLIVGRYPVVPSFIAGSTFYNQFPSILNKAYGNRIPATVEQNTQSYRKFTGRSCPHPD
jgi:hypothetical protein